MLSVRLFETLKFRIVALAAATAVIAALGAAVAVLRVTQTELQQQLLNSDQQDRERTATLLGSKLETLKTGLQAVALAAPPAWRDAEALTRFLLDKPVLGTLFDSVIAVGPDGAVIARIERGRRSTALPNIADRDYFRRALLTDQPVVSEPLVGKVSKKALVIIAVSVIDSEGRVRGVIAGTLSLQSNSLFPDTVAMGGDVVRDLVMDRHGALLWHTDPKRVLGRATDEPGLGAVFARWHSSGSPIDTAASAELSSDHLVSMAGIPLSDWVLVRLTSREAAMASMTTAQHTAWKVALTAGLLAALLAGAMAWAAVRPIGRLRDRAERMLAGDDSGDHGSQSAWPRETGEIGAMSRAFQVLLQSREEQHSELQAVLDNADVGLALSRDGRFEMVSRHFCTIFGYPPADLVGQPTRRIHPSDEAYRALSERAQPAFMKDGLFDGEVELVRRDGRVFWARMRGRAVKPGDRSKGTIWVVADATQDHEQHARLSWAASHDRLTGLMNRAAFEALLEEATEGAAKAPFCALFIDLDRFKQVNDTGGHAAGDALLRDVARELAACLRKSDTVARLGGDEFAVLLPQCPVPQAQALAEQLRSAIHSYRLSWEERTYAVGISIGLVAVTGVHANGAEVLKAADAACYAAKRGGRNQVAVAADAAEADAVAAEA